MNGVVRLAILWSSFFVVVFAVGHVENARADRRIVPGSTIPLAAEKVSKLEEIMTLCLREETVASLYPSLATVGPAPGTSAAVSSHHTADENRTGDETKWTTNVTWLPATDYSLRFLEWTSASTSIERELALSVVASSYGSNYEEIDLDADFSTDAEGHSVDVGLRLSGALPYIQVELAGAQVCSVNNWGRESCVETEKSTAIGLVIPKNFANSGLWINRQTNHLTQKTFNYFKYAECLLWNWER